MEPKTLRKQHQPDSYSGQDYLWFPVKLQGTYEEYVNQFLGLPPSSAQYCPN